MPFLSIQQLLIHPTLSENVPTASSGTSASSGPLHRSTDPPIATTAHSHALDSPRAPNPGACDSNQLQNASERCRPLIEGDQSSPSSAFATLSSLATRTAHIPGRRIRSCLSCHQRKTKCDRKLPCSSCISRPKGAVCNYDPSNPEPIQPETPAEYVSRAEYNLLHQRLESLWDLIRLLMLTPAATRDELSIVKDRIETLWAILQPRTTQPQLPAPSNFNPSISESARQMASSLIQPPAPTIASGLPTLPEAE